MFETDELEIWNLTPHGTVRIGAVEIVNVVGRIRRPEEVTSFVYRLNGAAPVPVYFSRADSRAARLRSVGDFNIDTIALDDLRPSNVLELSVVRKGRARPSSCAVAFHTSAFESGPPAFKLDLGATRTAEQVGQVVDGRWTVAQRDGMPCLELLPADAGYDRIILFGSRHWTTGYEILARLAVTKISGLHNVGLIFKWNPYERGDGTRLPTKWSTGLGYYSSYGPAGLRIRFGVGVHKDAQGRKLGDHLLARAPLNRWRWWRNRLARRPGATELDLGQRYRYRLRVRPEAHTLTVWIDGRVEPRPQVTVVRPPELLARGAAGIFAYQTAVRLFDFEVNQI